MPLHLEPTNEHPLVHSVSDQQRNKSNDVIPSNFAELNRFHCLPNSTPGTFIVDLPGPLETKTNVIRALSSIAARAKAAKCREAHRNLQPPASPELEFNPLPRYLPRSRAEHASRLPPGRCKHQPSNYNSSDTLRQLLDPPPPRTHRSPSGSTVTIEQIYLRGARTLLVFSLSTSVQTKLRRRGKL